MSLQFGASSKVGARRYAKGDFDFLVGYDLFTDMAYVWSWAEVEQHKASITIAEDSCEKWEKLIKV